MQTPQLDIPKRGMPVTIVTGFLGRACWKRD